MAGAGIWPATWKRSRSPTSIARSAPDFFAFGNRHSQPDCLIEQSVNAALEDTMRDAEQRILARLSSVTLADIFADFRDRFDQYPGKGDFHV